MTPDEAQRLSFYNEIAEINKPHGVTLVQHCKTKKIFVKKILYLYHKEVYDYLQKHPIQNIPLIYEIIPDDSALILIEEYISGNTLQELLEQEHHLSPDLVMDYILQLCSILQELHSCTPPIVHRDLKPSNVIVTPQGRIVLLDLNGAKYTDPSQERDTILMGTQGYAAPEQYGFGPSNVQTDLYSLGILMKTLLTGDDSSPSQAELPFSTVISQCTQLDPQKRFHSIGDVKKELVHIRTCQNSHPFRSRNSHWLRFLPPGFRRLSPPAMILAILGYAFIFLGCMTFETEGASGAYLTLIRVVSAITFLAIVFFSWDYLDIQQHVPLCRSRSFGIRISGTLLIDFLLLACMIGLVMLAGVFF